MTETLAIALGVPAVLGTAWLASQRRWSLAHADQRGIALQTVIVIVVMLVIAGGVAGVLLSRGGEVITDLEAQDVSAREITSEAECEDAADALTGDRTDADWTIPSNSCVITSDNAGEDFSSQFCRGYRALDGDTGVYTESSNRSVCTIA